jgi:hypothetical protein
MTPQQVILTYREYEALPADGRRYEIHGGGDPLSHNNAD